MSRIYDDWLQQAEDTIAQVGGILSRRVKTLITDYRQYEDFVFSELLAEGLDKLVNDATTDEERKKWGRLWIKVAHLQKGRGR